MKSYFENMAPFGKALKKGTIKRTQNNYEQVIKAEKQISAAVDEVKNAGLSEEKVNQRGQMTVWQRLEYIVDPDTWAPLHTLFNPADNIEGTKLYRQGLLKMNEFVTLCGRDQIPVIWFQDTSGIDVGDVAEKAELLGLGQSLIYSIQQSGLPMMLVILRKGTAAAHYVMGGPQANRNNAFTLGTCATQICVMHGETAAVATYARRLVKDKEADRDLEPVVEKMNALAQKYKDTSTPLYCAKQGMVDEVVRLADLRHYMQSFAGAAYQNPKSICPQHQMILPRIIRDHAAAKEKE
ncbi:carboxyl transferase domain-containing protein [Desulfobacter sp.]|uniref:carboxyl transferase domain-containing protein n=1 Tax=Desulfobacter sp. TaxID=2294 RepID=UPI003D1528B7